MRRFGFALIALTALASAARADGLPEATRAQDNIPTPAGDSLMPATPTFVLGNNASNDKNVKVSFYGFVEADTIIDSTQSFTELQGNTGIAKIGTEAGDNSRFQMGARNSRFGFKVESPTTDSGVKAMGNLEMDFLGVAGGTAEANIYSTPTFRMRHGFVKLQTPAIDVLVGQTWSVLGSSMIFTPATVDIQGVPAELYARTLQIRLGKTLKFGDFAAELEIAAQRPYQHDVGMPDFGGFLRLAWDGWKGYKATGGNGGDDSGIQLSFSTLSRAFRILSPTATSTSDFQTARGTGFALDAIVPILPASKKDRGNGLTFTGELSTGSGYGDQFTSNNFGVSAVGTPMGASASYVTGASLDAGPAGVDKTTGALGTVDAKSMLLSLQYFLPIDRGAVFLSLLYGTLQSDNAVNFTAVASAIPDERYVGADLFWDVTQAARLGLSYGKTRQRYGDNSPARTNDRVQLSAFYIF